MLNLKSLFFLFVALGPSLFGCGNAHVGSKVTKVALLPLRTVGLTTEAKAKMRKSLGQSVVRTTAAPLAKKERVDKTAAQTCKEGKDLPSDEQSNACAIAVGAKLGASHALIGAVGGLGQSHVLQLRLMNVRHAVVARSLEETMSGDLATIAARLDPITRQLFALPKPRPWYKRWWFWTALGAAAAAAVILPLTLGDSDPHVPATLP